MLMVVGVDLDVHALWCCLLNTLMSLWLGWLWDCNWGKRLNRFGRCCQGRWWTNGRNRMISKWFDFTKILPVSLCNRS